MANNFINAFVEYDDGRKTGELLVTCWDDDLAKIIERKPADDSERLAALEQIVLELHAKIKRLSE